MSIDSRHIVEQRSRAERTANAEVIPVPDPARDAAYTGTESEESDAAGLPLVPLPPFVVRRSGIYRIEQPVLQPTVPQPIPVPTPHIPIPPIELPVGPRPRTQASGNGNGTAMKQESDEAGSPLLPLPPITPRFGFEELRVDVDGIKPTMTVSGTITRLFAGRLTWIARVTKDPATGAWTGPISYRDGSTALRPQASVAVQLTGGPFRPVNRKAIATFSGGTGNPLTLTYNFEQAAFREVAFEYDTVSDATAVTSHNPATHPVHAPTAPTSTLTLESAYARLGIQVTKTGGDSVIPTPPGTWSDQEMHDAMQAHWSRWADAPQWAIWVLFARLHDQGTGLGGIMFDDIGVAQRQGTSIFSGSFIAQPPAGEANPGAWVERMKFWTAMHEIGHSFNLAHSWQKSLGTAWVPLANEPSALSYMNYPFNYPGGLDTFFAAFDYGFSPDELLFLRHAPERYVRMGAEPWFSNHGFEQEAFDQLRAAATGPLELEVRVHRETSFEFLEPVVAELRLKNVSSTPMVIDANALRGDGLAIVVSKEGGETKRWLPFARYCMAPAPQVLQPGDAIYESVFLSAGTGGWLVSEPGTYTVYAVTESDAGAGALSKPMKIVVERPTDDDAERLADDVFTKEVAHTLAFGGSRVLTGANETLQQVAEQLPDSRAAVHANSVLGAPKMSDGKVLVTDEDGNEAAEIVAASPEEGRELLAAALGDFDRAADSLGHIAVTEQTKRYAKALDDAGDTSAKEELLSSAADALARRGVLPGVVEALRNE